MMSELLAHYLWLKFGKGLQFDFRVLSGAGIEHLGIEVIPL